MPLYAVQYSWVPDHATKAPVGIWDATGQSFFPPLWESFRGDGEEAEWATVNKPWEQWLEMRAEHQSTYGPSWVGVESDASMAEVLTALQTAFFAVEHPALTFVAPDDLGPLDLDPDPCPVAPPEDVPLEPAGRFVLAQSWWIASELCRRNSRLHVREDRPMDGFYHGLAVADPERDDSVVPNSVFLNWGGRIHIHAGAISTGQIPWAQTFAAEGPHETVKQIEASLGWSTASADGTTGRSLVYRTLAACLWQRINDRFPWSVADGQTAGGYEPRTGVTTTDFLTEFNEASTAVAAMCEELREGSGGVAMEGVLPDGVLPRVWALRRGERNVVLLLDTGVLYRRGAPPIDLLGVYRERDRLDDVTSLVFATSEPG